MKKFLFIFALLLLYPAHKTICQQAEAALKEVFKDAEFFFVDESYPDALAEYVKLYKRGFNNANINYKIGICYLKISGQKDKSVSYLETAIKNVSSSYKEGSLNEKRAPIDAYLYLGNAYRVNNQLDKSIEAYGKYKELLGKSSPEDRKYADQQIEACKTAQEFMLNPVKFKLVNIGKNINTIAPNYRPAVSGDGKTLVYINKLKFYDAVMVSRFENGVWQEPFNITQQLQSDGNQYPASLSYDGNILLLTKEDNFNSDIYVSEYVNGQWTTSKPLGKNINTKYWESFASMTADGKTLYFASNRKEGFGNLDIFYSVKDANGQWGPAKNLGNKINTPLNEDCPVISPDGKTLFFSSQGHKNMGGFDIFYSKKISDNEWSEPVNMGYSINTTDDDLYFSPEGDEHFAYMARFEKGGFGAEDIYCLELLMPEFQRPELLAAGKDVIKDKVKETPLDTTAKNLGIPVATNEIKEKKDTAKIIIKPPAIKKEEAKETYRITGIHFGFNSYQITDEAKKQLDILGKAMLAYTSIEIEIRGYADSKGSIDVNMAITKRRAEAVAKYLASKGIKEQRLRPVAMGKSNPIALNMNPDGSDNPQGRRYNRRAELKLLTSGNTHLVIEQIKVPEALRQK